MTPVSDSNEKHWFALYTKPRQEFKAEQQLHSISIDHYLPTITVVKRWSDRKKKIDEPIFRGYIFINVSEKERLNAMQQSAIVRTICFNGKPSVIPDCQIESLRKMLNESKDVIVSDNIVVGTKVKIADGPFKDVIGIVTERQEDKWLAVTVELIHRSVMVRLPKESVIKFLEK